jgi:hypothetical protein
MENGLNSFGGAGGGGHLNPTSQPFQPINSLENSRTSTSSIGGGGQATKDTSNNIIFNRQESYFAGDELKNEIIRKNLITSAETSPDLANCILVCLFVCLFIFINLYMKLPFIYKCSRCK